MDRVLARLADMSGIACSARERSASPGCRAPAPWEVRARALCWAVRPGAGARAALEEVVAPQVRVNATPVMVVGALIRYEATPVGPYDEVTAVVVHRRAGALFATVPFMAVSSPAGLAAGRENWALPKTLARFTHEPRQAGEGGCGSHSAAVGDGWHIEVREGGTGRIPMPVYVPGLLPLVQLGPGGTLHVTRVGARGLARRAHVEVHVHAPPPLRAFFPAGRHTALLLTRLEVRLPPADRR
ncbi:acetoacetate decarboxylase family protein [Streptomyces sp. NPDC005907]|uniref:acetoacetate decarboxylase family protein n=1 Tax=Streptomyces sp. NPDC005907 TaxID=3154571 RepID=UPI0033CB9BBC